ncbi:MAG: hypothetical protein ACM3WP_24000 [Acidobacteriota bacterium]
MRCNFDSPYRFLHTAYVGPHGEQLTPVMNGNSKRKGGCWVYTDEITREKVETESDLPRANSSKEKRQKQSKSGKRAWQKPTRRAANRAWAKRVYGDPDAPDTWTPQQRTAREQKAAESLERYGDSNAPETWTPEQKAARAKVGDGQEAFWARLSPRQRKHQSKRRTVGNSRPEVKRLIGEKARAWHAAQKAELERLRKLEQVTTGNVAKRSVGRPVNEYLRLRVRELRATKPPTSWGRIKVKLDHEIGKKRAVSTYRDYAENSD